MDQFDKVIVYEREKEELFNEFCNGWFDANFDETAKKRALFKNDSTSADGAGAPRAGAPQLHRALQRLPRPASLSQEPRSRHPAARGRELQGCREVQPPRRHGVLYRDDPADPDSLHGVPEVLCRGHRHDGYETVTVKQTENEPLPNRKRLLFVMPNKNECGRLITELWHDRPGRQGVYPDKTKKPGTNTELNDLIQFRCFPFFLYRH